jgi:hypothetical protein
MLAKVQLSPARWHGAARSVGTKAGLRAARDRREAQVPLLIKNIPLPAPHGPHQAIPIVPSFRCQQGIKTGRS